MYVLYFTLQCSLRSLPLASQHLLPLTLLPIPILSVHHFYSLLFKVSPHFFPRSSLPLLLGRYIFFFFLFLFFFCSSLVGCHASCPLYSRRFLVLPPHTLGKYVLPSPQLALWLTLPKSTSGFELLRPGTNKCSHSLYLITRDSLHTH